MAKIRSHSEQCGELRDGFDFREMFGAEAGCRIQAVKEKFYEWLLSKALSVSPNSGVNSNRIIFSPIGGTHVQQIHSSSSSNQNFLEPHRKHGRNSEPAS